MALPRAILTGLLPCISCTFDWTLFGSEYNAPIALFLYLSPYQSLIARFVNARPFTVYTFIGLDKEPRLNVYDYQDPCETLVLRCIRDQEQGVCCLPVQNTL